MTEQNSDQEFKNQTYHRPKAVEERYGISTGTLANWRSQGIGPRYVKLGVRAIGYGQLDLEDWISRSQ